MYVVWILSAHAIFLFAALYLQKIRSKLTDDSTMSSKWWVLPLHANLPPEEPGWRERGLGFRVMGFVRIAKTHLGYVTGPFSVSDSNRVAVSGLCMTMKVT